MGRPSHFRQRTQNGKGQKKEQSIERPMGPEWMLESKWGLNSMKGHFYQTKEFGLYCVRDGGGVI